MSACARVALARVLATSPLQRSHISGYEMFSFSLLHTHLFIQLHIKSHVAHLDILTILLELEMIEYKNSEKNIP